MAQKIFAAAVADDPDLTGLVRVSSCGIGGWHAGDPADNRARAELLAHGYSDSHVASQLGPDHFNADLLVAMDTGHVRELERKRLAGRTRLLRSFDPAVAEPSGAPLEGADLNVADPFYGSTEDFTRVREQIEAAVPGMLAWAHAAVAASR